MTDHQLFAFVLLPIAVPAAAWALVLLAERRGAARPCPEGKAAAAPPRPARAAVSARAPAPSPGWPGRRSRG
ncbi:hypothetical protein M0638_10020 [Roseomonas sp. NAR14]|uniref:Uncharacterized protein n=1 Tax=Roseomonas acroporae TaxID=2937791 RepID=A0A9X1Y7V5_9PROT|nr:hypothetical protein [Roseomonas acroporae]MCK8784717.1 hypothetical protein [Roseomonas acroporae]